MTQTLSGATQKLECWKPQGIPATSEECHAYREIIKQVVFAKWNTKHEPIDLTGIYREVKKIIQERIKEQIWPNTFTQFCRSKRFIDRRVNELACPLFAENGIIKIVAVSAGIYESNPVLFELPRLKEAP